MAGADKLDWNDLRYFLHVAQARSLAGAARTMGVEHSTIGRRLSAMERSLGSPLFIRGPEGLRLTPLGERIAPLVALVERAVQAVQDQVEQQKIRVRLAIPSGLAKLFTAKLATLRDEHPEISLELLSGSRPVDLKKGEADLALRGGIVRDEDLLARKVGESGHSLYASPAYLSRRPAPIDVKDLSGHEVIGIDVALAAIPPAKWMEERSGSATVVMRIRELADMVQATLSGAGIALLPCVLGDDEPGLVRLTPEVFAPTDMWLVYRRELRQAEPVRAVIRFVMAVMNDNAGKFAGTIRSRADPDVRTAGIPELTPRERQLLELIARGLDNSAIAVSLGLQAKTVRNHITRIFDKLGVRTRAEAIVKAREAGLGTATAAI